MRHRHLVYIDALNPHVVPRTPQHPTRSHHAVDIVALRFLMRHLATRALHVLKWFVHEFLLLAIDPAAGSELSRLCRFVGCLVIVLSLRAELREGLLPNTAAAVFQFGLAAVTAIWEIQFKDGTWLRCETGVGSSSCEWTEPGGRCTRFELRLVE